MVRSWSQSSQAPPRLRRTDRQGAASEANIVLLGTTLKRGNREVGDGLLFSHDDVVEGQLGSMPPLSDGNLLLLQLTASRLTTVTVHRE